VLSWPFLLSAGHRCRALETRRIRLPVQETSTGRTDNAKIGHRCLFLVPPMTELDLPYPYLPQYGGQVEAGVILAVIEETRAAYDVYLRRRLGRSHLARELFTV